MKRERAAGLVVLGEPSIRTAWERAVERAKLDDFHFHDTRHHFASWFMMQGGSLLALNEILGHASLTMTQRYAHLSPGHLKAEVAKTERQGRSRADEMVDSEARLVSS